MYWLAPAWASCLSILLVQVLKVGTIYEKVLQPTKYLLDFYVLFLHWFCRWALRPGQIILVGLFGNIVGTSYHHITWLFEGGWGRFFELVAVATNASLGTAMSIDSVDWTTTSPSTGLCKHGQTLRSNAWEAPQTTARQRSHTKAKTNPRIESSPAPESTQHSADNGQRPTHISLAINVA